MGLFKKPQMRISLNIISEPIISFTVMTIVFPLLFPPTDFFDKLNRKLRVYKLWTNTGGLILFALIIVDNL